MQNSYYSITQINNYIKNIMESDVVLSNICIYGEVATYSESNNIAYFSLKDENGLINCVMFNASRFKRPSIGDVILATGGINYYAKMGKLTLNVFHIVPYGKGLLYEKFLELKNKLEAKGYFKEEIKKPIPKFVKTIGVVSSPTGAVIQDIRNVTRRRNNSVNIVLYPVKVQGVGSENEIAKGIEYFSKQRNVDVVIVARGGGSLEELQPFNSEIVADATYNCEIPIVSAVGHETDYTIIDFVSDLRAPTPSAAAELVVWSKEEFKNNILTLFTRSYNSLNLVLNSYESDTLNAFNVCANNLNNKINLTFKETKNHFGKIDLLFNNVLNVFEHKILINKEKIEGMNPENIYKMGYVKVLKDNKVVKSAKDCVVKDMLKINFKDGLVNVEVK